MNMIEGSISRNYCPKDNGTLRRVYYCVTPGVTARGQSISISRQKHQSASISKSINQTRHQDQEEIQPIHTQKECQAKGSIPAKEAKPCTCGVQQNGEDTFKCDICGNAFKSDNGLRIHKGKSHKGSELPHREKIRDPGVDLSLKDIREEGTSLQVFECDACGKKFEFEDTQDNHIEIHGECVRCFSCTQFFYDCDEATVCPGCSTPWPFWQSNHFNVL